MDTPIKMEQDGATYQAHHLVTISPFPLMGGTSALQITLGLSLWMHNFEGGLKILLLSLVILIYTMILWFRDIIREGTFEGVHTNAVQEGLRLGMILFITSEVYFFLHFFGHTFQLLWHQLLKLVVFFLQKEYMYLMPLKYHY